MRRPKAAASPRLRASAPVKTRSFSPTGWAALFQTSGSRRSRYFIMSARVTSRRAAIPGPRMRRNAAAASSHRRRRSLYSESTSVCLTPVSAIRKAVPCGRETVSASSERKSVKTRACSRPKRLEIWSRRPQRTPANSCSARWPIFARASFSATIPWKAEKARPEEISRAAELESPAATGISPQKVPWNPRGRNPYRSRRNARTPRG